MKVVAIDVVEAGSWVSLVVLVAAAAVAVVWASLRAVQIVVAGISIVRRWSRARR